MTGRGRVQQGEPAGVKRRAHSAKLDKSDESGSSYANEDDEYDSEVDDTVQTPRAAGQPKKSKQLLLCTY